MQFLDEEQGTIFKTLFEAVSEGIIVVNVQQKIVGTNSAANAMFGYDSNELTGEALNILIPRKYHSDHKTHFKNFVKEDTKRSMGHGRDLYGIKKDGSQFPVEAGLNPFMLDNKQYVMAIITDITDRKNYTENLERTVQERTRRLTQALTKEKELNELKTKFLSLVAHEFKTPLSGILTSATLAGKYTKEEQQEKRVKHLNTIQNKVKYLNNIISDFLSIERLESGKVNYMYSIFPLSKVVNEVIYDANMLLKEGQRINYPANIENIELDFDEKILELVLTNVVNNAVKYSPENTIVDIQVKQDAKFLYILVIDSGMGIPEKDQKFIFERYFRAENALLDQGTGIGLNIVKSHLENLGGAISFESEEGKGSKFELKIPKRK